MSGVKVETKTTINGEVVEKIGTVGNFTVYQGEGDSEDHAVLFFADKNGQVFKGISIDANCAHNNAFIDEISIYDI